MMRPTLLTNGMPSVQGTINVDFDTSAPSAALATVAISGATWDSGLWDTALWADDLTLSRVWQGTTGIGYCGAPRFASSTNGLQLQYVATDIVIEPGGIL